jgi:lipid A oxidase
VSGSYLQGSTGQNSSEPFKFTAAWKGNSFSMPPYYGLRLTKWNMNKGWGLDFNHSKAYADSATLLNSGFDRLQFTDGLNNLTVHQQRKLEVVWAGLIPYYGYGVGIIVPHVEVQTSVDNPLTFKYQYGGPTVALNGGFKLPLKKNRFFFTEYKFTASWLDVKLNGGGVLSTRIFTNALNVGLGFDF